MNKVLRTVILCAALCISFVMGSQAAEPMEKIEALLRGDIKLQVDGVPTALENDPIEYKNRTYVPFRAVAEMLGAQVGWNGQTRTIHIQTPEPEIVYVERDPEPGETNPPSSGGSAGDNGAPGDGTEGNDSDSGGTLGSGEDRPDGPVPLTDYDLLPDIRFSTVVQYEADYFGETYEIMGVQYDNTLYFRVSDLLRMPLDLNGMDMAREEETRQLFAKASDISPLWVDEPSFRSLDGPVIVDVKDEEMLEALEYYMEDAFYVERVDSDEVVMLKMTSSRDFYLLEVDLRQSSYSDNWYVQTTDREYLYEENEEDDDN